MSRSARGRCQPEDDSVKIPIDETRKVSLHDVQPLDESRPAMKRPQVDLDSEDLDTYWRAPPAEPLPAIFAGLLFHFPTRDPQGCLIKLRDTAKETGSAESQATLDEPSEYELRVAGYGDLRAEITPIEQKSTITQPEDARPRSAQTSRKSPHLGQSEVLCGSQKNVSGLKRKWTEEEQSDIVQECNRIKNDR